MIWRLYTDEYFKAIQRCTYNVEAETLQEAIDLVKKGYVYPDIYGTIDPVDEYGEVDLVIMDSEFRILDDSRQLRTN